MLLKIKDKFVLYANQKRMKNTLSIIEILAILSILNDYLRSILYSTDSSLKMLTSQSSRGLTRKYDKCFA